MDLSNNTKLLIVIGLLLVAWYLVSRNKTQSSPNSEAFEHYDNTPASSNNNQVTGEDDSAQKLINKMLTRNSAKSGYKKINYSEGNRNGNIDSLDQFFTNNNPLDANANGFSASNEMSENYATYNSSRNGVKMSDKEKFDASGLLPQEKNDEWFDDPQNTSSIKATNLINVFRPAGVNTIQTTMKNPSHDLRGTIPNPKTPVSPWQNSSYEPDTNLRGNNLCA